MCTLTSGGDFTTACPAPSAGLKSTDIWLANRSEVTFTGESSGNHLFTSFTMATGKTLFRYSMHITGNAVNEEFEANDFGGGNFRPSLTLRSLTQSNTSSKAITDLVGSDLVAIVRTKNDKFIVLGSNAGLTLTANTMSTDADNLGESFTLGTVGEGESTKHKYLLDTDVATTYALLEAAE